jgi:zinc/manganese transport system substrate-binding protein
MPGATRYLTELDTLDAWAKRKLTELPRSSPKLVTTHDAFQYFGRDFGFTIYAIEGLTPADEPSCGKVARIIAAIRTQRVKAVFPESIENPKVLREITCESGAKVGPELYADGLGEGAASAM